MSEMLWQLRNVGQRIFGPETSGGFGVGSGRSLFVIPGLTRDPPFFFQRRIKDKAGPGSSPG
jgi:hypothetical protein